MIEINQLRLSSTRPRVARRSTSSLCHDERGTVT